MASACAWSVALTGLEGRIEVEADIAGGLPRTVLVGLPDSAPVPGPVPAINSGHEWPMSLLTINLSPATLPKAGSHRLPIVAAILAASRCSRPMSCALLGELGLDGRVRPVPGSSRPRLRPLRPASPA